MRTARFVFFLGLSLGLSISVALAEGPDGLEKQKWKAENWGNSVNFSLRNSTKRGQILQVRCQHGSEDKVIFSLNKKWDAKEYPFLVMDVRNLFSSEVGVAVAVSTGPRGVYFESSLRRPPRIGDFQRVIYDLSQPNFKCAKYLWIQGVPIENLQEVRKLFIVLFPQNRQAMGGTIELDNIRVAKGLFEAMAVKDLPFGEGGRRKESLGDFDNDGRLDRLVLEPVLSVRHRLPDGAEEPVAVPAMPPAITCADWADLNRDGNQDIVAVSRGGDIHLLLGDGNGDFRDASREWVFPPKEFPSPVRQIVAFDAEPDGDEDLFFQCEDGSWVQWRYESIHGQSGRAFLEASIEDELERCALTVACGKEICGVRELVSERTSGRGGVCRAMWFLPPGRYRVSRVGPGARKAAASVLVQAPGQRLAVTSNDLFPLYPKRAVHIDGRMAPGEWDTASKVSHVLSYVDFKTKKEEQHPLTLWYQADPYALYLCIKIEGDDFGDSRNADMLYVFFDNDGDKNIEQGEDVRSFWSNIFNDYFIRKQPYRTWWERDPFLDGSGAVTHSNPKGIGDYVYELMVPWRSYDPLDLAITGDAEIGIKITFAETRKHGNFWFWGQGGMGRDGFPDSMQWKGQTYARLKITGLSREPGKRPGKVGLTLSLPAPARALAGRVTDEEGVPVKGAKVWLTHSPSPSQGQRVLTGEGGRYRLPFEPAPAARKAGQEGEHWVLVLSRGYAALAAKIGGQESTHDFTLEPGLPVAGKILDPAGRPLVGAELLLYFGKHRWISGQGKSGPGGRFRLEHQPKGPLTLTVLHRDRAIYYSRDILSGKTDLVIRTGQPIRVEGRVVDSETGAPVKQFALYVGQRVKHGELWSSIYWPETEDKEFQTDTGRFEHRFGKEGEQQFYLCLIARGHAPQELERSFRAGDQVTGLRVVMRPGQTARGKVIEEGTGKPIRGAKIKFWRHGADRRGPGHPSLSATTGPLGKFQIDTLAKATYSITASAAGYASRNFPNVPIGSQTEPLAISLFPGASVRGTYRLAGKAVTDREVGLFCIDPPGAGQGLRSTPCGPAGDFAFTNLGPGSYLVLDMPRLRTLSRPGINRMEGAALVQFQLGPGEELKIRVGTDRGGATVRGKVSAEKGQPAKRALVVLSEMDESKKWRRRWVALTDEQGRYALEHVDPGQYRLSAGQSKSSLLPAGTVLTVPKGAKAVTQNLRAAP